MADPAFSKSSLRRRTCVICSRPTPNTYVTSFTRVPDKQEEWVNMLSNGDYEYAELLKRTLTTGRKYLCLDHFDRKNVVYRKGEEGMEVVKNSLPIPYRNAFFVRHDFSDAPRDNAPSTSSQASGDHVGEINIPEKRQKTESELRGKGAEMNPVAMNFLMNTVNVYVKNAMEEAPIDVDE
ncbi:unnamed protein product [Caenorhabditis brenneri]